MGNLEESLVSLTTETIDMFKQISDYSGKAFASAYCCVIFAPFSRQASKKQHQDYVENRKLLKELLRGYKTNL